MPKQPVAHNDMHNTNQQVVPKQVWVETKAAKAKPSDLGAQQEGVTTPNPFDVLQDAEDLVPESAPFVNAGSQDQDLNKVECHTDEEMSTDDDKEFVGETQFQSPADFMDRVTVSVDDATTRTAAISDDAKRRLIAKVKKLARKRQLRSDLKAKSDFAQGGTSTQAPGTADPQQHAHNTDHDEAAEDLRSSEVTDQPSSTCSPTEHKDAAVQTPAAVPAVAPAAVEDLAVPAGIEGQVATTSAHLNNKVVDSPPAQVKGIAKRSKNKRKVAEVLPKRQLRSSTKNKSISEITPEMIQAYADNQCHYVPTDSLGQPKAKQVAPNSPHPTRAQIEDKLRAAKELGRLVLDTGQKGASQAMDFAAIQQWDDLTNTAAYIDSDSD